MIIETFRPNGATGATEKDFLFEEHLAGPNGMDFYLLKETWHTKEDMQRAKKILKQTRDVVSIYFVEFKK